MPTRRPTTAKTKPRKQSASKTGSKHPMHHPVTAAEKTAIGRLRRICLALPEVTEKIAWGEPTWRAGRMFAQMETHHHGGDHVAVWLPARPGVQEELVEDDPELFFRPPYVGHLGWVGVRIDRKPDWAVVAGLVADAYRLVAPPHLVDRLEAQQRPSSRGWRAGWIGDERASDAGRRARGRRAGRRDETR